MDHFGGSVRRVDLGQVVVHKMLTCEMREFEVEADQDLRLSLDDLPIVGSPLAQLWGIDFLVFHCDEEGSLRDVDELHLLEASGLLDVGVHIVHCQPDGAPLQLVFLRHFEEVFHLRPPVLGSVVLLIAEHLRLDAEISLPRLDVGQDLLFVLLRGLTLQGVILALHPDTLDCELVILLGLLLNFDAQVFLPGPVFLFFGVGVLECLLSERPCGDLLLLLFAGSLGSGVVDPDFHIITIQHYI